MLGFVTGVGQGFACRLAADGWDLYHKATHSQIRPRRFGARDRALGSRCSGGCDPLAKAALQELAAGKRLVDSPVASQPVSPLGLRHQIIRGEACRGLGL